MTQEDLEKTVMDVPTPPCDEPQDGLCKRLYIAAVGWVMVAGCVYAGSVIYHKLTDEKPKYITPSETQSKKE